MYIQYWYFSELEVLAVIVLHSLIYIRIWHCHFFFIADGYIIAVSPNTSTLIGIYFNTIKYKSNNSDSKTKLFPYPVLFIVINELIIFVPMQNYL